MILSNAAVSPGWLLGAAAPSSAGQVLLAVFASMAVFSALATITRKNPIVAAVWLVLSFFSVAGCYVMLHATFLAAIQVLVYAGAMMVLFVFVIMVLDVDDEGRVVHRSTSRATLFGYTAGVVLGVGMLLWVFLGILARQYAQPFEPLSEGAEFGAATSIGRSLFDTYLFAFEAVSLLLLAAVIGAVVVARSRREREKEAALTGMPDHARHAAGLTRASAASDTVGRDIGGGPR